MAGKKRNNKPIHKIEKRKIEAKIDNLARVLQIAAMFIAAILILADILVKDYELPVWTIPAILGIAAGLSPEQIAKILVDIVKSFLTGRKK